MNFGDRIKKLNSENEEIEAKFRERLQELSVRAEKLLTIAEGLNDSATGSALGRHAELYYRGFQRPPEPFSIEWGEVYGHQEGWEVRTSDQVKAEIEKRAGVSFDDAEDQVKGISAEFRNFQDDLLAGLAFIDSQPSMESEKQMLKKIEQLEWSESPLDEYCATAMNSTPNMSRDSNAVMQGSRLPAHIYYQAVAHKLKVHIEDALGLIRITRRLLRQAQDSLPPQETTSQPLIDPLATIRRICNRFHLAARQLQDRHQNRETLRIKDEYDVQDLLHSLLRLHFEDVRPEEWTPSFAGASSRMDFLLKNEEVVVECKMTRKGLADKELGEQLIHDIARYKSHSGCKILMCLVFDADHLIKNPQGLENDLNSLSTSELKVEVITDPR